ncbi:GspE/PulE family protein [Anaerosporobacter faecicola]|uniref:GspE/PulE family protein n=1 Tax=Anaerosporobacter faecicola TaxID=2718714 RepID=UPI001EE5F4A5|nr:ATPase, T2SS/T4P/T4SS family [Anaerosporobacter faecicola]
MIVFEIVERYGMEFYSKKRKRLGDLLIASDCITQAQLEEALTKQKETHKKLGETLIELGLISEADIVEALHTQLGLDVVKLGRVRIEEAIIHLANENILRKYQMMPFAFKEDNPNVLRVAMADPLDIVAVDDLAIVTNYQIEVVVSTPTEIISTIEKYYGNAEAMAVAERYSKERETLYQSQEEKEEETNDVLNAPIVLLVKKIIEQAVRQRASDIHIEPLKECIRVRYRIDGVLTEVMKYDLSLLSALVARIKVIGEMDISEKRKPQDGRITSIIDKKEYDIRVSVLPTVYGEKIVMRITAKDGLTKSKIELGFSSEEMDKFNRILSNPYGIILVTGPTGSGKSTTLYTALSELNQEDVNIITVEDPVEANIDGVNQVQVNTKAELTFATALRSILRQDPDIIMIGEMRDSETAQIAVKASITGHLVVSTLHTNDSAGSIIRLIDMGIEPYLIADSVVGVIAQRLVRRLCPYCKKEKIADAVEQRVLGTKEEVTIYDPCGCHMCNDTGYLGRIGVYEIMPITPSIKESISQKASLEAIKKTAEKEGLVTLYQAGVLHVLNGITSVSELMKIIAKV